MSITTQENNKKNHKEKKEYLEVDDSQSYQIYTKNGQTKFYVNGVAVKNVKRVKVDYDIDLGKPIIVFEIRGATSTGINVATLDRNNRIGQI